MYQICIKLKVAKNVGLQKIKMARDYTNYNVENLGENLNKRKVVFTIVKDWVEKNNPSFEELQKVFPDEVQGSKGFIRKESEVNDPRRFNMREPLKIKNGEHVVVSNQWGKNVEKLINLAKNLGYNINKANTLKAQANGIHDYLKETSGGDFSIFDYLRNVNSFLDDFDLIENVEHQEIVEEYFEQLLDLVNVNPNKYGGCVYLFMLMVKDKSEWEVWLDFDFDIISANSYSLQKLLDEGTPVKIVCKDYAEEDFKMVFITKFIFTMLTIIDETDDYKLIAELIVASNINQFTNSNTEDSWEGDWVSDMVIEMLKCLGFDIYNYENEIEIEGRYFLDMGEQMGYDYIKLAEDFRDANI